ncbi:cupin domain-containing protein [Streptomyces arenae]|uniref:cupin domain-containing protein n=1 Tax=Streptomyces arenae TaxID=29301 RepID=UPI0026599E96|nr:cupin domain-containing protein [Streptomyces arenae]MCG7209789.1 cupin domain-containing protein [Streptomyces arenae]
MSTTNSSEPGNGAVHVPASGGVVKWVSGDEYSIKLTGEQSNGSLGFVVATVPPGNGPVAHIHLENDESFFLLDGELEFLSGEKTFTASTGDFVFVPRGVRHRFRNLTTTDVKMAFLNTPGGPEEFFLRYGDEPLPGHAPELWTADRFTPEMLEFSEKVIKTVVVPE